MKELQDLTLPELLDLYNQSQNSNLKLAQIEVKADQQTCGALTYAIHERNKSDALQLNVSSLGCLYSYKMDSGQICPDVLPALRWLQDKEIKPFC